MEGLKRHGVDVFSPNDQGKRGLTDEEQLATANELQAAIFTHNTRFLKVAIDKRHMGIIYVNQQKLSIGECIRRIKIVAVTKSTQQMKNKVFFL